MYSSRLFSSTSCLERFGRERREQFRRALLVQDVRWRALNANGTLRADDSKLLLGEIDWQDSTVETGGGGLLYNPGHRRRGAIGNRNDPDRRGF